MTQITQGAASGSFTYDNANRRTSLTLPNGVSTEYAYDAASRLTGLTYQLGPTPLGTLTYAYDANGNRTVLGGSWARTGLPAALASATYNAANHQLTFGSTTLTYDLNGNLASDGTNTYTWDARNRLGAISGGSAASFQYDAQGRRTSKTVNTAQTGFLYDGMNPVQELTGSTVVANLLTGLGIDEYLTRTDTSGASHFLADALGSTVALTDSIGAVPTSYTYAPFGATSLSGSATDSAFDYTGREDDGTGLKYYRARYYHPGLQRFVSEDPMEFDGGGVNLYVYVANNPIMLIDPLGLKVNWGRYKVGSPELRRRLELFSDQIRHDIDVTGGDRTEEENEKAGGAKDSRHLIGGAVDFHVQGLSDCRGAALAAESGLFNGIGYYPPNSSDPHIHVDLRSEGGSPRWRLERDTSGKWVFRGWHSPTRPLGGRKC